MAKTKNAKAQGARYIGDGASIPGIPARDLSAEEIAALSDEQRTALVTSGLYTLTSEE